MRAALEARNATASWGEWRCEPMSRLVDEPIDDASPLNSLKRCQRRGE